MHRRDLLAAAAGVLLLSSTKVASSAQRSLEVVAKLSIGSKADGWLAKEKISSTPTLMVRVGKSGKLVAGGEKTIPNHTGYARKQLTFGFELEVYVHELAEGKLLADVTYVNTSLTDTNDADVIASSGSTAQMSGLFQMYKSYRISQQVRDKATHFVDVTFEPYTS